MRPPPPGRSAYPHHVRLDTRFHDNDAYGHVNNVVYYAFFDTVVNRWLVAEGGLDLAAGEVIGVAAESGCTYVAPLAYPEPVEVGLRVGHLGTSSVRYELAVFAVGDPTARAHGFFVHVFVDRPTRRPTPIPPGLRAALERLRPPAG